MPFTQTATAVSTWTKPCFSLYTCVLYPEGSIRWPVSRRTSPRHSTAPTQYTFAHDRCLVRVGVASADSALPRMRESTPSSLRR